jgi:hypothetical protein
MPPNPEPTPIKTPWGRRAKSEATLWRHKPDGTYGDRPKGREMYYREYYHVHRAVKVHCEQCGRITSLSGAKRHRNSYPSDPRANLRIEGCITYLIRSSIL